MIEQDDGLFGMVVSASTHIALRFYVSALFYATGFCLTVIALLSDSPDTYVPFVIAAWFAGTLCRRLLPFVVREEGKIASGRIRRMLPVKEFPRTLPGLFCLALLLSDAVLLPLSMIFSTFRGVPLVSYFGFFLWPPRTPRLSPIPFHVGFWLVPLLGSAVNIVFSCVLVTMQRISPFDTAKGATIVSYALLAVSAAVLVPSLTYAYSAFGCDAATGRTVYGGSMRCQSAVHKVYLCAGLAMAAVVEAASAVATAGTCRVLSEVSGADPHDEARMDTLCLETLLLLRSVVVVQGAFAFPPYASLVLALALLGLWLCRAPSSVACAVTLVRCLLGVVAVNSLLCAVAGLEWTTALSHLQWCLLGYVGSLAVSIFCYLRAHGGHLVVPPTPAGNIDVFIDI